MRRLPPPRDSDELDRYTRAYIDGLPEVDCFFCERPTAFRESRLYPEWRLADESESDQPVFVCEICFQFQVMKPLRELLDRIGFPEFAEGLFASVALWNADPEVREKALGLLEHLIESHQREDG